MGGERRNKTLERQQGRKTKRLKLNIREIKDKKRKGASSKSESEQKRAHSIRQKRIK